MTPPTIIGNANLPGPTTIRPDVARIGKTPDLDFAFGRFGVDAFSLVAVHRAKVPAFGRGGGGVSNAGIDDGDFGGGEFGWFLLWG
ncbi:hypothetical protein ACHAXS_008419 [Conticribra weissflogii]